MISSLYKSVGCKKKKVGVQEETAKFQGFCFLHYIIWDLSYTNFLNAQNILEILIWNGGV